MHQDSDNYVIRDDQLLIGQHRLGHWPQRSISVWRGSANHHQSIHEDVEERMLRFGFEARTRDFLTPMLSDDYGTGIAIPLWAATDRTGLETLITSLRMALQSLIRGDPADPEAIDRLTDELLLPAMASRFHHAHTPTSADSTMMKQLCADHHIENFVQDQDFIECLFADLPMRAHAHPYLPCVLFDFFLMDVCALQGSMRTLLMQTLLTLNQTSSQFSSMSVGLDNRHFIVATAYASTEELHHHFQPLLERWVELAFDIRDLCKTLVFEGATIEFEVTSGFNGEIE